MFLDQPMRQDEADTVVLFALGPWRIILIDGSLPNNHLAHSLLVKAAITVLGNEPWVVRLPAFLSGVAAVPMTFVAGRALGAPAAGLVGAALVAVSTPMVLFSTNARGYSLICLAALVLIWIVAPSGTSPGPGGGSCSASRRPAGFSSTHRCCIPLAGSACGRSPRCGLAAVNRPAD
jgi:hypothetical protein